MGPNVAFGAKRTLVDVSLRPVSVENDPKPTWCGPKFRSAAFPAAVSIGLACVSKRPERGTPEQMNDR